MAFLHRNIDAVRSDPNANTIHLASSSTHSVFDATVLPCSLALLLRDVAVCSDQFEVLHDGFVVVCGEA
jgi:hypothetical protein